MSTSPVQLDLTKMQPISSAPAAAPSNTGVQLDFSKLQPINAPASSTPAAPEDKRSFLQIAIDNSPSGADPQNPGNPTQQGLAQMSPEGRQSAQKQLATTAGITAAGTLAGPAIADTAQLGSEYAEYAGQRLLQFSESQLEKFAEAYPHLSKLASHLGYPAGVVGAIELFRKLVK